MQGDKDFNSLFYYVAELLHNSEGINSIIPYHGNKVVTILLKTTESPKQYLYITINTS